ncbi:SGNH/GDSL hydrolase family protein [Calidithermus terrae]|uniref:SGNH/GDSL hydrolase family protein n=1 Tax=Calidithermus terrae TaxID=1408545 RepID=UPI0014733B6A|nr:SGNH/GDSL hydrolase family protein [Calidithermus terrae]
MNKLRAGQPVTIVAVGTSSTEGVGASSPKTAFPAVLQDLLKQAFPSSSVTVINKGQGGQVNQQLVVRLEQEVLALKPDLVIWQTGTNDAVNRTDLPAFKRSVTFALTTLRERGIEVILMDGQFFPEAAQSERYRRYQEALAEIADATGVPLVPRYTIMKHLVNELRLPFTRLLADDHFHPSDFTYACMASYVKGLLQAMP